MAYFLDDEREDDGAFDDFFPEPDASDDPVSDDEFDDEDDDDDDEDEDDEDDEDDEEDE